MEERVKDENRGYSLIGEEGEREAGKVKREERRRGGGRREIVWIKREHMDNWIRSGREE